MEKSVGAPCRAPVRAQEKRWSPCLRRRDFERGLTSRRFAHAKCERRKSPCYKKQMNDKDNLKSFPTTSCFVVCPRCWRSRGEWSGFLSHTLPKSMRGDFMRVKDRRILPRRVAFNRVGSLSTHRSGSSLTPLSCAPKDARGWTHSLGRYRDLHCHAAVIGPPLGEDEHERNEHEDKP